MASKNELINKVVAGLLVALMMTVAGYSINGNAKVAAATEKVAAALNDHKDDDTPHAGIAVANARLEIIEKQLSELQRDIKTILKGANTP